MSSFNDVNIKYGMQKVDILALRLGKLTSYRFNILLMLKDYTLSRSLNEFYLKYGMQKLDIVAIRLGKVNI